MCKWRKEERYWFSDDTGENEEIEGLVEMK